MRKLIYKNLKITKNEYNTFFIHKYLKTLKKNKLINLASNYIITFLLKKKKFQQSKKNLVCLLSSRRKGVFSDFYLSRLELKKLFLFKEIPNSSKYTY